MGTRNSTLNKKITKLHPYQVTIADAIYGSRFHNQPQQTRAYTFGRNIIEGECIVTEIDNKRLLNHE